MGTKQFCVFSTAEAIAIIWPVKPPLPDTHIPLVLAAVRSNVVNLLLFIHVIVAHIVCGALGCVFVVWCSFF